jgi:hypothetical protein
MQEHPSKTMCEICGGNHTTETHPLPSQELAIDKTAAVIQDNQQEAEPSNFERLSAQIEKSPLMGSGLSDMIQIERLRQTSRFNLPPDTRTSDIAVACDSELLAQLKARTRPDDSEVLDKYSRSSDHEPLNFQDRQAVVNIILNPTNRIYKNENGADVNLPEYLKDYYAPLGMDIDINFSTLTKAQSRAVDHFFKIAQTNFSGEHLEQESIAIPFIQIKKGDKIISIPIIGGDRDVHAPMRDPETREKIGSFVGLKIVHEPQLGSSLATNTGFMVHELDHAIRKVLNSDEKKLEKEDRIVLEGTAEFARHHFSDVQNRSNPNIGYGLANALMFAGGIDSEGTEVRANLKHTYASGLILSERINSGLGKEEFFELTYDSERMLDESQLSQLRQKIVNKLEKSKTTAREFMTNF